MNTRKRHPQSIRDAADALFAENKSSRAVAWELGLPQNTVYPWWREWNGNPIKRKPKTPREYARECALSSDADDGDAAQ